MAGPPGRRAPAPASSTSKTDLDRRSFLALLLGAAGLAVSVACEAGGPDPAAIRAKARTYDPDLECSGTSGLLPAEIKTRTGNAYTDRSPSELELCFTCANFVAPKQPASCASCTTVKGAIHPLGWCEAWAQGRFRG